MITLTTAAYLGASVIEKHFTFDKKLKGNDHYHAMDYKDLITLNKNLDILEQIMGMKVKKPIESELNARKYARRSIVAKIDIKKGDVLKLDMLTFKRKGTGISPKHINLILNKITKRKINKDEIIKWNFF